MPEAMTGSEVAVIGLACRFPGAATADEFWTMVRDGAEGISFFSRAELEDEDIPVEVLADPGYVPAKGYLPGTDLFDAAFFGYSPREAAFIDPQQRLFLECAWDALENAGVDPETAGAAIGVYGGSSVGTYLDRPSGAGAYAPEAYEIVLGNDKDQLTTRASYKLNLRGPSVCVQTACSTSLVAVHMACQSLLSGDCDVALAGGVSVTFPSRGGYLYRKDGIYSQDGHCRSFDAAATGTLHGDGVGVVVLKLLDAAIADGDHIWAVVKGTAVNNDGGRKVGYSAPSITGQAEVIRSAHRVAGVDPATIGYVEAHGTGTAIGDPAEVAGLTRAFRAATERRGFCALGSVKSAIGHLDAAAGVAGLIKAVLALAHGIIPPALFCDDPNPAMNLSETPFFLPPKAVPWPASATPRRAGVSSFGIGGTNAHALLEEAPILDRDSGGGPHLVLASAKTSEALDRRSEDLAGFFDGCPADLIADAAHTTRTGRSSFAHRRFAVGRTGAELAAALGNASAARVSAEAPVAFLFPGQGSQYPAMAADLCRSDAEFRAEFDAVGDVVREAAGIDIGDLLLGGSGEDLLEQTRYAQLALFTVECALAGWWRRQGVRPAAMLGHSIGEYVAACLAGVFTPRDAVLLIAERGRLMGDAPPGAMLAVGAAPADLDDLPPELSIAAVNADDLCVVAGSARDVEAYAVQLGGRGLLTRRLRTRHAFHTPAMADAAAGIEAFAATLPMHPPTIPFVSNVTGTWITDREASDPAYWGRHTLDPVRFAQGVTTLFRDEPHALLEVGPGTSLSTAARRSAPREAVVVASMRPAASRVSDRVALLTAVGQLWVSGTPIRWGGEWSRGRRTTPLPTYPYDRRRYWISQTGGGEGTLRLDATPVRPEADERPAEPLAGPVEQAIADAWERLLGVRPTGREDDFFRLGGHSLFATRLAVGLREQYGIEITLSDILSAPTVAGLASVVEALTWANNATRTPDPSDVSTEEGIL